MNKIVREHYPVERLPEDLRAELGLARTVTVTLEQEDSVGPPPDREWLERLRQRSHDLPPATDDPVARIRRLRDEWDN